MYKKKKTFIIDYDDNVKFMVL